MPPVQNPKWLVSEFQKSGEFDRLRKQLQTHFLNSDQVHPLMSRVEEIAREKLSSDNYLEHKTREAVYSEVMQDMERYPIVERAVSNLGIDKDTALLSSIDEYLRNILRGESNENTKLWNAQPSSSKGEQGDYDESSEYSEDDEIGDDELLIITDAETREDNGASTKLPASEDEILTKDDASHIALDEIKLPSGDVLPQSAPLNQPLPVPDSQPALSLSNQNDAISPSPPAAPQPHIHPDLSSPVGEPSSSSSTPGILPVVDIPVGCSSGRARAALDDHADASHDINPGGALHLLAEADANSTAEALVPVLSHEHCVTDIHQDASSPANEAGTYLSAESTSCGQGSSQTRSDTVSHQPPYNTLGYSLPPPP